MFTVFTPDPAGLWKVTSTHAVFGEALAPVAFIGVTASNTIPPKAHPWRLVGTDSNRRYTDATEKAQLLAVQEGLGRPHATCAALIPIRKTAAWWDLAQDERRAIFEDRSKHISASMKYLPDIARKLYHCRDLKEPFDFLTWFEFAPEHTPAFNDLVAMLRATEEWKYVDWEYDIRLQRTR